MTLLRHLLIVLVLGLAALAPTGPSAQEADALPEIDRSATGGATTLEDILRRQEGLKTGDDAARLERALETTGGAPESEQLGTLGGASDSLGWLQLRYDAADVSTQVRGPAATVLIQDSGMWWLEFREGPLLTYGGYLLLGTIGLLVLFFLIRGRIRIDGPKTGRTIQRFAAFERFSHWLLAGSFILLGLTGLISLMGRKFLIPALGHEAFSDIAIVSKWVHNNVSWAFMVALVFIFFLWVMHNLPDRTDINWLLKGGGIFSKGHPPAKKFNAGQKLIFWSVIVLGASISVSGLALLFPFELPMFAATFAKLNAFGITEMVGLAPLPETLAPHQEMQYSQLWHAIVSFVLMAIILAHIYIGSVGMEGAFDAMGKGDVEEQWAREHHSLWVDEVKAREGAAPKGATPAE
ncbi:formate dehydrogenase subunit gamma [Aestuariicoccus sp. MJ-SS9]|uniref:formate dehydrogenase subunit gamma n=1 Tax=Aestuariicoccus sp. MJ-SS9 TaxID=3079855 RepID=UPI00290DF81F|nr:formate dehydrogenase subunit gamma [Aestuariicoccus sp. MJ-SS9]MDU8912442.1 formate dehydrogenase subunit gamma [Aestuariicoccus sp. MJ-SS9]